MSEDTTKTFVFPEAGSGSQSSVDPNVLLAMMNGGNGGFGGNNAIWIIFLLALFGRNGFGLGNGGADSLVNNDYGRSLLMSAIQGNRTALSELSSTLNSDINSVQCAIGNVQSSIQAVGNQVGLTGQQVINSIQSGNATLASQLAQCCCDNKLAICQQTNALTSRIDQLANGVQTGFASTAYETAQQTCNLQNTIKDSGTANTNAILSKLDAMVAAGTQAKIDSLLERNSALTAQLSNEHQTQTFAAMLAPIQSELASIKAAQPNTITTPYQPFVAVPNCLAYQYGLNNGGSIWG